jgi:hypothetical protein
MDRLAEPLSAMIPADRFPTAAASANTLDTAERAA